MGRPRVGERAIILYFRIAGLDTWHAGPLEFYDKIPPKRGLAAAAGVRVVPPGTVRYGAFCEPGVVVMPGFVNIGARVGSGTMVDTWATVGSCAQIGRDVHLSGGVGIGGVLEPPSAQPVIVEDGAFIGSRCILVEGVIIEAGRYSAPTPRSRRRLRSSMSPARSPSSTAAGTRQLGRDPWHPSKAIPRRLSTTCSAH